MSMSTKKTHKRDDAVSPVVGVMLMLVTTILIATLVAALASGVADDVEKSSTAVLDVKIESMVTEDGGMMVFHTPKFYLTYLSGDTKLDTSKMKIVSSWVDSEGNSYTHTLSGYSSCRLNADSEVSTLYVRSQETLEWNEYPELAFGNIVLTSGDTLTTCADYIGSGEYDYETGLMTVDPVPIDQYPPFEKIFGEDYGTIEKGTQISITIIYNKHAIFEKVVTVE